VEAFSVEVDGCRGFHRRGCLDMDDLTRCIATSLRADHAGEARTEVDIAEPVPLLSPELKLFAHPIRRGRLHRIVGEEPSSGRGLFDPYGGPLEPDDFGMVRRCHDPDQQVVVSTTFKGTLRDNVEKPR
jgi:hypothetical protein